MAPTGRTVSVHGFDAWLNTATKLVRTVDAALAAEN
jgi:hypothetical protein